MLMGWHSIVESMTENCLEPLYEQTADGKTMFLEGIMAQAEIVNKNKRRYLSGAMCEAVDGYIKDYVKSARAIGELNHPKDYMTPNPERASQLVTDLKMDGDNVVGKTKILDKVPMGKIVRALNESGVRLGVSTRAMGVPKNKGSTTGDIVRLRIYAIDNVADPSAHEAWPKAMLEAFESMHAETMIEKSLLEHAHGATKITDLETRMAAFTQLLKTVNVKF